MSGHGGHSETGGSHGGGGGGIVETTLKALGPEGILTDHNAVGGQTDALASVGLAIPEAFVAAMGLNDDQKKSVSGNAHHA